MRGRAFTLVEVLLAAVLGLLILGVMTYALVPMLRYAAWGSARVELAQAAALISQVLVADLQKAPMEGLSLPGQAEPGLLAIHPVVGVTDTGLAVWDRQEIVYSWDAPSRTLRRKLFPPGPPAIPTVTTGTPLRLSPQTLRSLVSQVNGTERVLVRGLLRDFSLKAGSVSSLPLHLQIVLELAVPGHEPERFELGQDIYLRSGQR